MEEGKLEKEEKKSEKENNNIEGTNEIENKEENKDNDDLEEKEEEEKKKEQKEENPVLKVLGSLQLKKRETVNEVEIKKELDEINEKEMQNLKIIPKKDFIIAVVYNISPNVTENHIKEIFSYYGEIKGVYIPKKGKRNLKENYAFIEFIKKENAEEAQLYMDGGQIDGKEVKVEILNPKNYIKLD